MKKFRVWLFVAFLMAAAVAFRVLPVGDALMALLEWMRRLGPWGPVAAAILYVPAAVCMVPGSALTLCAGFLFGVPKGMVAMSLGSVAGACAAFLVGRVVARDWVRAKMAGHPRFHAVSQAVGREGFKMVFLLRLSPAFPFNLLNYAFSMTPISFGRYALASWLGMLPGTLLYVYLGSGARSLAEAAAGTLPETGAGRLFFWFGLAATVVATVTATRLAKKALGQSVEGGADATQEG